MGASAGGLASTLGNLIFIGSWTFPLFLLPTCCVVCTVGHSLSAGIAGLVLMGFWVAGPTTKEFRGMVCAIYMASAVAAPPRWRVPAAIAWVLLAAMTYAITDANPQKPKSYGRWPAFCTFMMETLAARSYFAAAELRGALEEIKPGKTMFAVHPHGILTHGWTWNLVWNFGLHGRCGRIGFLIDNNLRTKAPLFRMVCDWYESDNRYALPATKSHILSAMERGDSLALLPGGFQEACLCQMGKDRVYVKKRQGFVKYCLQGGYSITPVYTFGESDTYYTFTPLLKYRMMLGSQNVPAALMWGRWFFPVLPFKETRLVTVVGSPVELPKIPEPSNEDVAKWHAKYVEALQSLFDKHKAEVGKPGAVLEVW